MEATHDVTAVSQDRFDVEQQVKRMRTLSKLPGQGRLSIDEREIELLILG